MKKENLPPRKPSNYKTENIDLPVKQIRSKDNTVRRYPTLPLTHSLNMKQKKTLNKPPRNIEHNMSMKNMTIGDKERTHD